MAARFFGQPFEQPDIEGRVVKLSRRLRYPEIRFCFSEAFGALESFNRHFVDPLFPGTEDSRVIAFPAYVPVQRQADGLARRGFYVCLHAGVVLMNESIVGYFGGQNHRFFERIGMLFCLDGHGIRSVAHEPAQHLFPEDFVRGVAAVDLHAPVPRGPRGKSHGLPAAETLESQQNRILSPCSGECDLSEHGGPGFGSGRGIQAHKGRQCFPTLAVLILRKGKAHHRMQGAVAGQAQLVLHILVRRDGGIPLTEADVHGKDVLERSIDIPSLCERILSAEHQKPAAALAYEIGDHAELVEGEERGLHAAQYQALERVKLPLIGRKAFFQRGSAVFVQTLTIELAVRLTQQREQPQVLVLLDRAPQERVNPARFAFAVENARLLVLDANQYVLVVILGNHFVLKGFDPEVENPGSRRVAAEVDFVGLYLAVASEGDFLTLDQPVALFNDKFGAAPRVPGCPNCNIRLYHRVLEHLLGHADAGNLHVAREVRRSYPDRVYRDPPGAELGGNAAQILGAVVGAIRDQNDS